jgi:mRNA-degrading endonuclease HigB of HigAB toxin-antitoxin module
MGLYEKAGFGISRNCERLFLTLTKLENSRSSILEGTKFDFAAVHYNRNKIYIRHVLTHQEYDAGKWKK